MSLRDAQNNAVQLQSRQCEIEMKLEKSVDQFKRDLEQKEQRHDLEVDKLNKAIHGTSVIFKVCTTLFNNLKYVYCFSLES